MAKRALMSIPKSAALLGTLLTLFISGCGKTEAPAAASAASAAAPVSASAPPTPPEPLKVGLVYVGPVADEGWTFAHDNARKAIATEFGDKIETTYVEKVTETDVERVMRDLIGQGNTLIIGTTFGYMEPMLRLAAEFKDVKFEHVSGFKLADNMRPIDARIYEGTYMSGILAASMSKTGVLGVVATHPIPWSFRNINAFALGAQSVNPKARVKIIWINTWFDPIKEADAAQTLINQNADVLFATSDSTAPLLTAEKRGKYAFGFHSDMSGAAPNAHLASSIINWTPHYRNAVSDVLNKTWKSQGAWLGVRENAIDLVSISPKVPAEVKARIDQVRAGLKDGTFQIWKGPITQQDNTLLVKADAVASDDELKAQSVFVKGIEGKVPAK